MLAACKALALRSSRRFANWSECLWWCERTVFALVLRAHNFDAQFGCDSSRPVCCIRTALL